MWPEKHRVSNHENSAVCLICSDNHAYWRHASSICRCGRWSFGRCTSRCRSCCSRRSDIRASCGRRSACSYRATAASCGCRATATSGRRGACSCRASASARRRRPGGDARRFRDCGLAQRLLSRWLLSRRLPCPRRTSASGRRIPLPRWRQRRWLFSLVPVATVTGNLCNTRSGLLIRLRSPPGLLTDQPLHGNLSSPPCPAPANQDLRFRSTSQ